MPARPHLRPVVAAGLAAVLLGACTSDDPAPGQDAAPDTEAVEDVDDPAADPPAEDDEAAAEPSIEGCLLDGPGDELVLLDGEPDAAAAAIVQATTSCAPTLVVALDDPTVAAAAASLAVAGSAPLLLDGQATSELLTVLAPRRIVTVGAVGELPAPEDATVDAVGPDVRGASAPDDPAADDDADADADDAADAEETTEDTEEDAGGADDAGSEGDTTDSADEASGPEAAALAVAAELGTDRFVVASSADPHGVAHALAFASEDLVVLPIDPGDVATSVSALPDGAALVVPAATADAEPLVEALTQAGVDAEVADHPADTAGSTAWLLTPDAGAAAAAATAAAALRDEPVFAVDGEDLRRDRGAIEPLRAGGPEQVLLVGEATSDADWQLTTVLEGTPLPWGGFSLFDGERMVALYGSPETAVLGAMGEQDLDATVERLREVAEPYGADGVTVRPTFEIISTIASAEAGVQGDYSRRTPIETIRPWVDRAAEEGIYVVLDLQPGRTDFLTQAQEYEELLREPHVGLALDPEWRLEPDQVHLRQIGSVSAAEVQEVADWLAALVREEQLPQTLLVLHQFRFSMLPDREDIEAPPELAVVVHMDGQGPIGTKYETYAAITRGHEDRWLWGWKNFYDEDSPTPTPEQVLALDPLPVFVSYQ